MPLRSCLRASLLAGAVLCCAAPGRAAAQAREAQPARYLAAWSLGVPLRITRRTELAQDRFAPAFTDALGGYILPGGSRFRHGAGLGLSLNLGADGGYTEPVDAFSQWVVMPSYLLYCDFGRDLFALGHLGVPILVHGGKSFGGEVGFRLGYRLLAGLGTFAQGSLDMFAGASSSVSLAFSLSAGLFLDYEVLP